MRYAFLALLALFSAAPASAQNITYYINGSGKKVPVTATTPLPVTGGAGGGGDASAANQVTTNTILGAVTASPTANTVNDRLKTINTTLSSALTVTLPTGAATSANQTTSQTSLSALVASLGTTGSTAPTTAQFVSGIGPAGNSRGLATDTGGRLLPGQGAVATTRTTLTGSTATALESAGVAARIGTTIFVETSPSANVYICSSQTTSCSATVYDFLIPSGATAGTVYTPMFGTTGRFYAYSTGTPVVVINSWTAQ